MVRSTRQKPVYFSRYQRLLYGQQRFDTVAVLEGCFTAPQCQWRSSFIFYNGSFLPYTFMFFTQHMYSYKKQKLLATVTHYQLLGANSGGEGFWLKEPRDKERRPLHEVALSRLVASPEDLRCVLLCPQGCIIWGPTCCFQGSKEALCCLRAELESCLCMNEPCDLVNLLNLCTQSSSLQYHLTPRVFWIFCLFVFQRGNEITCVK